MSDELTVEEILAARPSLKSRVRAAVATAEEEAQRQQQEEDQALLDEFYDFLVGKLQLTQGECGQLEFIFHTETVMHGVQRTVKTSIDGIWLKGHILRNKETLVVQSARTASAPTWKPVDSLASLGYLAEN